MDEEGQDNDEAVREYDRDNRVQQEARNGLEAFRI
jgi:hypothetical protein